MHKSNHCVSIGMPVYNGERFIKEALDSILAQTFDDFVLIISDNASEDKTQEICQTYIRKDKRIKYFRNEKNLGAAKNYNRVFELSSGQYFKWAAYDDICAPDFLARCVEVLDSKPEVVLCYTKTTLIDENSKIVLMEEDMLNLDSPDLRVRFSNSLSPMKVCHNPVMGLIRRNVLAKTRLIGNYLASDRCLIAELSLYGSFWEVQEKLFFRRKHSGNIGTRRTDLVFYDPSLKNKIVLPEWRVLWEHLYSIKLAPISFTYKGQLIGTIFQWVLNRRLIFISQLVVAIDLLIQNYIPKYLRPKKQKPFRSDYVSKNCKYHKKVN